MSKLDIKAAEAFIAAHVKGRECLLMAKNGEIIYESGNRNQIFKGYSMTKTVGFLLVLMAASHGELDIDADITEKYGVPSPKTYGVSCRMMMSMVLGGEAGPGELWEYDELGTMWMRVIPQVVYNATGKMATWWFQQLHQELQLSADFTWPNVETSWGYGASGTCEDWGRFAQLILNDGYWGHASIISPHLLQQAQQPVKYDPYNMYSNPCYGLGWWLNPDKQQYKGCCWEASRLPAPDCNNETFIQGGSHKLTFTLGLYGQVVLAVLERNVTVVSMGRDLRPIEPIRIGVYPGICKMLDLPCTTPPKIPKPRCGETLECLGMSAQCFSGYGNWSHAEPQPGGMKCVECFMQTMRDRSGDHQTRQMIQNNCPFKNNQDFSDYLECFCYDGDNVFGPWPTTSTTTPAPKIMPPVPHPYTTTTTTQLKCAVPTKCWEELQRVEHKSSRCVDMDGYHCGKCLYENWGKKKALYEAGCPGANVSLGRDPYKNWNFQTIGFCTCGPLSAKKKSCPATVFGVCNNYNASVTASGGRRRKHSCVAAPGSFCKLASGGEIPACTSYPHKCMGEGGLPELTSSDRKVNMKFWVNLSEWSVVGMEQHKYAITNYTSFAHACGSESEWSVVVNPDGKVWFYPSLGELKCPTKEDAASHRIVQV